MSILDKLRKLLRDETQTTTSAVLQEPVTEATVEDEYEIVEKEILPEKMKCPDCGGITLVGLEFCDKCGGILISQD